MSFEEVPISSIVQQICCLQEERIWNQNIFNESHRIFLESKNTDQKALSRFQVIVGEVTDELSRISDKLSTMHDALVNRDPYLAGLIIRLSQQESIHLQLMASLQVAKQLLSAVKSNEFPYCPSSSMTAPKTKVLLDAHDDVTNLKERIKESKDKIAEIIHSIRNYGASAVASERLTD
jgi:hypothetical protein